MGIQERSSYLEVVVTGFDGTDAIITFPGKEVVRWPIKRLPDGIRDGSKVRIAVTTDETEEAARKELAKEVLNNLLRG
ncbi:MAG: hypothetical protein WC505_04065 [Patescibacteria group bacterium]